MAESIIDATNGTLDLTLPAPAGGTAISYKCKVNSVAMEAYRTALTRITFCSSNVINNFNGMKGFRGSMTGYPTRGSTTALPFAYFLTDAYGLLTWTLDTGCVISMTIMVTRETLGMIAANNGSWSMDFENKTNDLSVTGFNS